MAYFNSKAGSFAYSGQTQNSGTAITQGIAPWSQQNLPGSPPILYGIDSQGFANWLRVPTITHVTNFQVTSGSSAQQWFCLRPLNWAVVSVAGAKNSTSFTLTTDPGKYSVNYKYPLSNGATGPPGSIADLTFTTTHYFAVQLADGTWFFDLCAGFNTSTLVVTTTTTIPNISGSGGGIPVGAIMFLLGSSSTKDPATGQLPPAINPPISATTSLNDAGGDGVFQSVHPGDPMYLYNANGTNASTLISLSGYYGYKQ